MKEFIRHIIREHITRINEQSSTRKSNTDEFILKAREVHGDRYDYSKTNYVSSRDNVTITCSIHGDFQQAPNKHLKGQGCPTCGSKSSADSKRMGQDIFIDQSNVIHDGRYNYDKVDYKSAVQKVIITCPIHGDFQQAPTKHLKGQGCPKCGHKIVGNKKNLDDFLAAAKLVHGDKYNYDKVDYVLANQKVIINCPIHGDFMQSPNKHISKRNGCPRCRESKGEKLVYDILIKNDIQFVREKKFVDCVNTSKGKRCLRLPFDFYLPEKNTCIEYDGEQHFVAISVFGGEESLNSQRLRDKIKDQYCEKNGIKLIRIPYTMNVDDVEPYILKELGIQRKT